MKAQEEALRFQPGGVVCAGGLHGAAAWLHLERGHGGRPGGHRPGDALAPGVRRDAAEALLPEVDHHTLRSAPFFCDVRLECHGSEHASVRAHPAGEAARRQDVPQNCGARCSPRSNRTEYARTTPGTTDSPATVSAPTHSISERARVHRGRPCPRPA